MSYCFSINLRDNLDLRVIPTKRAHPNQGADSIYGTPNFAPKHLQIQNTISLTTKIYQRNDKNYQTYEYEINQYTHI